MGRNGGALNLISTEKQLRHSLMEKDIQSCIDQSMNTEDETISLYGGTYIGELFNSVPSGLGTWVHPDGHAYIGKWINGDFNGRVAVTLEGGSTYVGGCHYDQFTPEGVTFVQPGPPHKDRVFHGQGTLTDPDGTKYVGEWRLCQLWIGTQWDKDGVVTEKYS